MQCTGQDRTVICCTALYCTVPCSTQPAFSTTSSSHWSFKRRESVCRFSSHPTSSFCLHYFFKTLLVCKSEVHVFLTPRWGVRGWMGGGRAGWMSECTYEDLVKGHSCTNEAVGVGTYDCSYAASQFLN